MNLSSTFHQLQGRLLHFRWQRRLLTSALLTQSKHNPGFFPEFSLFILWRQDIRNHFDITHPTNSRAEFESRNIATAIRSVASMANLTFAFICLFIVISARAERNCTGGKCSNLETKGSLGTYCLKSDIHRTTTSLLKLETVVCFSIWTTSLRIERVDQP